jgi:hypothetical protein
MTFEKVVTRPFDRGHGSASVEESHVYVSDREAQAEGLPRLTRHPACFLQYDVAQKTRDLNANFLALFERARVLTGRTFLRQDA